VELKFYIKMQEEDIRVQEEFVIKHIGFGCQKYFTNWFDS